MITQTEVELYVRIKPYYEFVEFVSTMPSMTELSFTIVRIYHMVSEKKPFSPTDYEELMNPKKHVERVALNENNVFVFLESLGYDSSQCVQKSTLFFTLNTPIDSVLRLPATMTSADFCAFSIALCNGYLFQGILHRPP